MPRSLSSGVLAASLVIALAGAAAAQGDPADAGVPVELSPLEKIAELDRQIMAMQAKGSTGPQLGDLYNDLGVVHAQREDWPAARDAFIRAVQVKPYDPDFHRNLSLVFLNLEDYDLAISELTAYRNAGGPTALDVHRLLAQAHTKAGDPEAARGAYREGLQQLGRTPSAEVCRLVLGFAGLEHAQGREDQVQAVLEEWQPIARKWRDQAASQGVEDGVAESEAIEENLLAIYLENGQILEESGLAGEAVAVYQKAYAMAPERDELLPRLVAAHLAAGDPMQAKVTARLARQDHPDQAGSWIASAKIHESEGQTQDALDAYRRALEIAPETPGLRLKVGTLYMSLGDEAAGREYLAVAIEDPDAPIEVVYQYGVSLAREQKYSAALAPLLRVTRQAPDFANGWQALGLCYREKGQYPQAVEAYQQALALQPDANIAHILGVTAGRAGMWDAALAAYDQALALDPDHREAAYNQAVALMQAGRLEDADRAFTAFLARYPDDYKANLNHGVTLYKLKRFDDAVSAFDAALEIEETAEAWDNLGLAYQGSGKKEKAQSCFKVAKSLRGKS
ncbi:MAG TPA: tetratricopeptide repeat protein [Candidatus Krumholzibacteria bacterium]|nr:tetratricopeptide repeat protein [Candidatus Krumholzibacteria bacterium]HPD72349.1 tetratricopeptide repeat protein [Candidatus Krumholzibacteria bacterium]HRY40719.1 tetratricopeptide repeat protein [Candidatus Krumholzibacteria bacterium]